MEDTEFLNRRYSLVGWGALLLWIGVISLLPGSSLPFGLGLVGIGVILLGIQVARRLIHKLPVNGTDITLGAIALSVGAAELFRPLDVIPVSLIAVGVVLLIRSALTRKTAAAADCSSVAR